MKIYPFLALLLFAIHLSCSDDPFGRPDNITPRQRKYQTNPNTQNVPSNQGQESTRNNNVSGNRIHVVATIISSEIAASEELKKYKNYGYPANFYKTTNGQYAVSVASFSDRQTAQTFMQTEIQKGKIPQNAFLTEMENSSGPQHDTTPQYNPPNTDPGYTNNYLNNDRRTQNLPADETPIYETPRAENFSGNQYHIVLANTNTYTDAVQRANQFIQQGLPVFVYEKTNGYAITYGKIYSQNEAATKQNQLRQSNNTPGIIVVARDQSWREVVFP
jgi:hypothetical protein